MLSRWAFLKSRKSNFRIDLIFRRIKLNEGNNYRLAGPIDAMIIPTGLRWHAAWGNVDLYMVNNPAGGELSQLFGSSFQNYG
jgi:hypothetical protein